MRRILAVVFLVVILTCILLATALFLVLYPRPVYAAIYDELDGQPVSHAVVWVEQRAVYAIEAGRYILGWLCGPVTVTVHADGYLPTQASVPKAEFPGQAVRVDIALTPKTLSGTVHDAETGVALANSRLAVGGVYLAVNGQGQYTLRRLRIGTLLSASMPGYENQTAVFSGQEAQDFALQPTETQVLVLDSDSDKPVPNAYVSSGSIQSRTDAEGVAVLKRLLQGSVLAVEASGYEAQSHVYRGGGSASIALRPNTLQGVVRDRTNGTPLSDVVVEVVAAGQVITSMTAADGRYSFEGLPASVTVTVTAPDYEPFAQAVEHTTTMDIDLQRFEVRGIYLPLGLLTSERRVYELLDLVDHTELNAIVVDMKNDRGWLAYPSALVEAKRGRAYQPDVMDIHRFLALCRERGIYAIARVVLFKDPVLVSACPEWAVRTADDQLYVDTEGSTWVDPFRSEVQDYLIAIAKEVAALGFDELQFDYVRFPSDGPVGKARYSQESTLESRCQMIREFCARLRRELDPYGVILSADLFGLTVWVDPEKDMGIGQRVIDIAPYMDYLSPMLYPATFTSGNLGYDDPRLYPYEIVYRSCVELSKRTTTRVRPWLQHYSWKDVNYGTEELRLEKKAADDAGTHGWMFWHAGGKYNASVFDPAEGAD